MLTESTKAAAGVKGENSAGVDARVLEKLMAALTKHVQLPLPLSTPENARQLEFAYIEYCRLAQAGDVPDIAAFCSQFPNIQDSLADLIRCRIFADENVEMMAPPELGSGLKPGDTFLGFRLLYELGKGGFATVFLATEPALGNRKVAVKISGDSKAEAYTQGRICHANIVPVYSVQKDEATGLTAVCMPYLGSATLDTLLKSVKDAMPKDSEAILAAVQATDPPDLPEGGQPPWSKRKVISYVDGVCLVAAQLADALQFIHASNIFHRDLKPANVLMTPEGRPLLLDFNLSSDMETGGYGMGGTLPYMPPEQLRAASTGPVSQTFTANAQSDLYAFGVMLYELLTGQHPFGPLSLRQPIAETREELLRRQQLGAVPLRQHNQEVSAELAGLVEQCLALDPQKRPRHAGELATAMRRCVSPWRRARRFLAGHPTAAAAVVCAVLAFAGMAAAWRSQQETDIDAHLRLGRQAHLERSYSTAVEHFDFVLKADPSRTDVLLARAHAFIKLGESDKSMYHKALADLHSSNRIKPSGAISSATGYCLLRLDDTVDAPKVAMLSALDQGFCTAATYNNLAFCCIKKSRWEEADKHLSAALRLNPNLQAALHNRGRWLWAQVYEHDGLEPPTKQARMPAKAQDKEDTCLKLLEQAKDYYAKALACGGPVSRDLYYDAALLWGVSAGYFPNDGTKTLELLERAVDLGTPQRWVAMEPAFKGVREQDKESFEENLQSRCRQRRHRRDVATCRSAGGLM